MTQRPITKRGSRFARILLVIAAVALVGRVAYVLTVTRYDNHFYDQTAYLLISESVVDGNGFELFDRPDAGQPPVTVLAATPATAIFGLEEGAVPQRLTMALLGALTVLAIGFLGRLIAGERVGIAAAIIAAIYPNLWISNGIVMADTPAALGVALALLFAYRLLRQPGWLNAVMLGLLCGLCALTRGELVLLVPLLAVPAVLLATGMTWRTRAQWGAVVVVVFAVTISPWVIRNMTTFEEPTYLSTGDGGQLLGANCDETYGGDLMGLWTEVCATRVPFAEDPSVYSKRQRDAALDYIGDHPGRAAVVAGVRVARTWWFYRPFQDVRIGATEGRTIEAGWAGLAMYYVLLPLAIVGVFVLHRRRITWWPLVVPAVIVTITVAISHGYVRYRVPAEVSIVVLAAVSTDAILRWWQRRRTAPAPVDTVDAVDVA